MDKVESINFRYDERADRIQLYACYEGTDRAREITLTRRFLSRFLPGISGRIAERGIAPVREGRIAPPVQANRETAAREHRLSQRIPVRDRQLKRSQLDGEGFLVHAVSMKSNDQGVRLTFSDESGDRKVVLQMTALELHRFIDQLTALAGKAEWGLADPWAVIKSENYHPGVAH
jgi:hypothetical protein